MRATELGASVTALDTGRLTRARADARSRTRLQLRLGGFARRAIDHDSTRLGVSAQELAEFAVLYYLADVDSGRIARHIRPPMTLRLASEPSRERHRD